jgi:hypothetical protein
VAFWTPVQVKIVSTSELFPGTQMPYHLSRVDHYRKITNRKQRTDIGKYFFVNGTIQVWNQLPASVLGTLSYKPKNFRKNFKKVINQMKRICGANPKIYSEVK